MRCVAQCCSMLCRSKFETA